MNVISFCEEMSPFMEVKFVRSQSLHSTIVTNLYLVEKAGDNAA